MELPVIYHETAPADRRLVREEYVRRQDGLCYWCGELLSGEPSAHVKAKKKHIQWRKFPPNFLRHPVHLQHCHDTGLTEGAVHALCNAVMWRFHGR